MHRTLAFGDVNKFAKETLALVLTFRLAKGHNGCFNNWRTLLGRDKSVHLTLRLARGNNGLRLCEQAPRAANLKSNMAA